jgi:hypothetical protein
VLLGFSVSLIFSRQQAIPIAAIDEAQAHANALSPVLPSETLTAEAGENGRG